MSSAESSLAPMRAVTPVAGGERMLSVEESGASAAEDAASQTATRAATPVPCELPMRMESWNSDMVEAALSMFVESLNDERA